MSLSKCCICENLINSDSEVVTLKSKGLDSLISSSKQRFDDKWLTFNENIKVHPKCRKDYTRPQSIKAAINAINAAKDLHGTSYTSPRKGKLRSAIPEFNFKLQCLFCDEVIDDEFFKKEKKKKIESRRSVHEVQSLEIKISTLDIASKRSDDWGKKIVNRITNVLDLVAVEAKYHGDCHKKFFTLPKQGTKRGRPASEELNIAMEKIYNILESSDECQYAIEDLIKQVQGDGYELEIKSVVARLKLKYKDDVIVSTSKKQKTTICFRDTGYKILTNQWYTEKKSDENEEKLRIVETAAKIIREEIRSQVYELDTYPSSDNFLCDLQNQIPEAFNLFLKTLIKEKNEKK